LPAHRSGSRPAVCLQPDSSSSSSSSKVLHMAAGHQAPQEDLGAPSCMRQGAQQLLRLAQPAQPSSSSRRLEVHAGQAEMSAYHPPWQQQQGPQCLALCMQV
jgi:hypothetical protein